MSLEGTSLSLESTPLPSPPVPISLEKRTHSAEPIQNPSGLMNNSTDGGVSLSSESADVSSDPEKTSTFEEHASFQPVKMGSNIGVSSADISPPHEEFSTTNDDGRTSGSVEIPSFHPQMLRRYPFWSELGVIREEDEEEQ